MRLRRPVIPSPLAERTRSRRPPRPAATGLAERPSIGSLPPLPAVSNRGVQRLLAGSAEHEATLPPALVAAVESRRGRGRPLEAGHRGPLEAHVGYRLDDIRIHDDEPSHRLSRSLDATAFTSGHDIFLGDRAPGLGSTAGNRLLAHEVTHAVDNSTGSAIPAGRLSKPGDAAERRAEASARAFRPGSSALEAPAMPGALPALAGPAGGIGRDGGSGDTDIDSADTATPDPIPMSPPSYRVNIVGHASPRWRRPGASTAEKRNLELSKQRAEDVERAARAAFRLRDDPVEFDFVSRVDDADDLSIDWRGSEETIDEAGGDLDADDEILRRVDVSVEVLQEAHLTTGMSTSRTLPTATTRWSVYIDAVLAGALGPGASFGQGRLKNRLTDQVVKGKWVGGGGGGGIDLPIPAVSIDSGWKDFTTESNLIFDSFEGTPARYSEVSIGLGIGYGAAYFGFPWFMESVYVGGLTFNQWGVGGSVTAGPWNFTQPIPDPPEVAEEIIIPYTEEVGADYGTTITFDTGSSTVDAAGLDQLADFILALP